MGGERPDNIPLGEFDVHVGNRSVHRTGNHQRLEPDTACPRCRSDVVDMPNHLRRLSDDHDQLSHLERNKRNACRSQRLQRRRRG